jgi:hypothetical protein
MVERRQHPRFVLTEPIEAEVTVAQGVRLVAVAGDVLTVTSRVPVARGEEVPLRIGLSDAAARTIVGTVLSSEPWAMDGRFAHRVRIALPHAADAGMPLTASLGTDQGATSPVAFVRRHRVTVRNLGHGGCLLELSAGLAVGTIAMLHGSHAQHDEPVRMVSLQTRRGVAYPYAAGAAFLSLFAPSSNSLRSLASRIEATHEVRAGTLMSIQDVR